MIKSIKDILIANKDFNYLNGNIKTINFQDFNDLEKFYVFLYIHIVIVCHNKYNDDLNELNQNENHKKVQLINTFFESIKNGLNNLDDSFEKLQTLNITIECKAKLLSIINSIIIDNPLEKNNLDTLKEINLETIENKNNCYIKANNIFKDIITNLTSNSLLTEAALELNSKYTKNYNLKIEEKYSIEISFITLDELKNHLVQLIPKNIYIINHTSDNYSYYEKFSTELVFNEKNIFKNKSKEEIKKILEQENNDKYTLRILCLLFHEILGHSKIRIIDPEQFSPMKFNYKGYLIALFNKDKQIYKEAGRIIENYLSGFNKTIIEFFYESEEDFNAKPLLSYKLYIGESLDDIKKIVYEMKNLSNNNNIEVRDFNDYLKEYKYITEEINLNTLDENNLLDNLHKYLPKTKEKNDECDLGTIKNYRFGVPINSHLFK